MAGVILALVVAGISFGIGHLISLPFMVFGEDVPFYVKAVFTIAFMVALLVMFYCITNHRFSSQKAEMRLNKIFGVFIAIGMVGLVTFFVMKGLEPKEEPQYYSYHSGNSYSGSGSYSSSHSGSSLHSGSSSSSSYHGGNTGDPYGVHDYNDAEEFADDWGDHFDSWEDAEDYWEDNY